MSTLKGADLLGDDGRKHWVDFAKTAAIILVVIYHLGGAGLDYLVPGGEAPLY